MPFTSRIKVPIRAQWLMSLDMVLSEYLEMMDDVIRNINMSISTHYQMIQNLSPHQMFVTHSSIKCITIKSEYPERVRKPVIHESLERYL